MVEVAIVIGEARPPLKVMGYICEECQGRAVIYPASLFRRHARTHRDNAKPEGQRCHRCSHHLPWNRFPKVDNSISGTCYTCRDKNATQRGRPKGMKYKPVGSINPRKVFGPGQEEGD